MKNLLLVYMLFSILLGYHNLSAQCDFVTPPSVKKIDYATREFTFSNVTINGKETTYLAVNKGQKVKMTTNVESRKNGDYCPDCIIQVYWGIRGHASEGAKSFHGYQFNRKKSTLKFDAPLKDGIYYITMGAVLDYSIKNNIYRPNCSANDAFAVLKVGTPDPEKKIEIVKVKKGNNEFLKASLIKEGCFVNLDKIEWFLEGVKLAYDNQNEIPLKKVGKYEVVWSNCLGSAAQSFLHSEGNQKTLINLSDTQSGNDDSNAPDNGGEKKRIMLSVQQKPEAPQKEKETVVINVNANPTEGTSPPDSNDIVNLIENSDRFIMKNLIFDLGKYDIKPEAKNDLNKLAQIMKDKPSMRILLEGHTDVRGGARKNRELSEDRVESTKEYLVQQGVSKNNIETIGWGHQKPLVITKDIEEGKVNRRVEIQILSR